MLLYHGSNMTIEHPRLLGQMRGLDFGAGFYLTTNEAQAVRFSGIVVDRVKSGAAMVSVYEFDMETAMKTLLILKFEHADVEWLHYIIDNRLKKYQGVLYDIVIGPVANDRVMPAIQAHLGGFLNEEATILTLKTSKLTDQVCLKSEQALSLLTFVKSFETEGAVGNG